MNQIEEFNNKLEGSKMRFGELEGRLTLLSRMLHSETRRWKIKTGIEDTVRKV